MNHNTNPSAPSSGKDFLIFLPAGLCVFLGSYHSGSKPIFQRNLSGKEESKRSLKMKYRCGCY